MVGQAPAKTRVAKTPRAVERPVVAAPRAQARAMKSTARPGRIAGKVLRRGSKALLVFKVYGKYYAATGLNGELIETYLHTSNAHYLSQLTNELGARQ